MPIGEGQGIQKDHYKPTTKWQTLSGIRKKNALHTEPVTKSHVFLYGKVTEGWLMVDSSSKDLESDIEQQQRNAAQAKQYNDLLSVKNGTWTTN